MGVGVGVCVSTRTCVRVHAYVRACMINCVCVCACVCVCVCVSMFERVYPISSKGATDLGQQAALPNIPAPYVCTGKQLFIQVYIHKYACVYTHMHAHTRTHTHTHIHTQSVVCAVSETVCRKCVEMCVSSRTLQDKECVLHLQICVSDTDLYGVATISRLLKIIGFLCKRAL